MVPAATVPPCRRGQLLLGLSLVAARLGLVAAQAGASYVTEGEMLCDPATKKCQVCTCVRIRYALAPPL